MSSHPSSASAGPSRRRPPQNLEPETAHERHQRLYRLRQAYDRGTKPPARPTKSELDVLKERHQFVRDSNTDPSTLSWEDQLAHKYYHSLFREFALVNLKHYKDGQIALRWRTEDEVLSGIGHLTCGSLRCQYHSPSPAVLARLESALSSAGSSAPGVDMPLAAAAAASDLDPDAPLVDARLLETEMQFGYVEDGQRKSALVKVVLCERCGRKVRYGREKAKREREAKTLAALGAGGGREGAERRDDERRRARDQEEEEDERRRRRQRRRSEDHERGHPDPPSDDDYGPSLPPDLRSERRRPSAATSTPSASSSSRIRRRSASPPARR
ncbi:hypothetical protein JCM10207_006560 [Rhodosporidiobolus poonsookiae]